MFGYHKRKRERRRLAEAKNDLARRERKFEYESPRKEQKREIKRAENDKKNIDQRTQEAKEDRRKAYEEGRARSEELFSRDVQGLDPAKRQAMQYEANKGIQRSMQSANRKLLGDQSQHGIVGKGGVGYAQQRDLQKLGTEAQAGVHRDLDKLNADLSLKKLAAMFNIEQGEASQTQLDKQMAIDEMRLNEEKKRQRYFEDQFNRNFSRV